jgi:hypothetical protein
VKISYILHLHLVPKLQPIRLKIQLTQNWKNVEKVSLDHQSDRE